MGSSNAMSLYAHAIQWSQELFSFAAPHTIFFFAIFCNIGLAVFPVPLPKIASCLPSSAAAMSFCLHNRYMGNSESVPPIYQTYVHYNNNMYILNYTNKTLE